MDEIDCKTGCLRQELDENKESLDDTASALADNFESAEREEVSEVQMASFKAAIDLFEQDLALFIKSCTRCKHFKGNGKVQEFTKVLNRAKELWEILS